MGDFRGAGSFGEGYWVQILLGWEGMSMVMMMMFAHYGMCVVMAVACERAEV